MTGLYFLRDRNKTNHYDRMGWRELGCILKNIGEIYQILLYIFTLVNDLYRNPL